MPPITSFPIGVPSGQIPYVHVRDNTAGADLYELNADTVSDYVASTTKLMVALLVHDYKSAVLDSGTVTVSADDVTQPIPPLTVDFLGLAENDVVTWRHLLAACLIASAGDAGLAMARVIGDELGGVGGVARFVAEMNTRGAGLGMTNTTFTDVYGGGKSVSAAAATRNQSTARDLSKLCTAALAFSPLRTLVNTPSFGVEIAGGRSLTITATNTNRFVNGPTGTQAGISDDNVVGGKTGVWVVAGDSVSQFSLTQIWTAPSGNELVMTVVGSISLYSMMLDARGLIYSFVRDWPYLTDTVDGDQLYDDVELLIGFDGSIVDESDAARALTVNSVVVDDPVIASTGGGLYNNAGDYVYALDAAALRPGAGDFTVDMWFAGDGSSPGAEYVFAAKSDHTSNQREWLWNVFGGTFGIFASADGANWTNGSAFSPSPSDLSTFFNGAPRHFGYVKEGAVWALYINGERGATTISVATAFGGTGNVVVGYYASAASFLGFTDDFRLTMGTARYTEEMHTIDGRMFARSAVAPPAPPPVAPQPFQPPGGRSGLPMGFAFAPVAAQPAARKFSITYPQIAPAGAAVQAAVSAQILMPPFLPAGVVRGPWNLPAFLFPVENKLHVQAAPPPARDNHSLPFPASAIVPGPWNRFNQFVVGASPGLGAAPPPPTSPGSPPPPPPPGTGVIGSLRQDVPKVLANPDDDDRRTAGHTQKVSRILNTLLERGFLKFDADGEYSIVSGGFSLPRDPIVTDDQTRGAHPLALFTNTLNNKVFICLSASTGSAVWVQLQTV